MPRLNQSEIKVCKLACATLLISAIVGCGFAATGGGAYDAPGFFMGIWHGLIAPWSLLLRIFMDIKMYAFPNSGWPYDFGFLIGIAFSLPIGWLAALIALVVHLI
jgi:hypothetical protein